MSRNCTTPLIDGEAATPLTQPDACQRTQGGDMTIRPPRFDLTVTNIVDGEESIEDLFADETDAVVVDDTLDSLILNQ